MAKETKETVERCRKGHPLFSDNIRMVHDEYGKHPTCRECHMTAQRKYQDGEKGVLKVLRRSKKDYYDKGKVWVISSGVKSA